MHRLYNSKELRSGMLLSYMLVGLMACTPTATPNYTIGVQSTPQGMVAIAPECLNWTANIENPYDNQPIPQFGCASARNLAFMVERPDDLIQGREIGTSSGVMAVGAMRRYENNQTRGILDPSTAPDSSLAVTSAPTASSSLSGGMPSGSAGGSAAPAASTP